jgi:spore maturation protein CgeB
MRTFMLSQYTDDLASLFREGDEAEFFRSKEELLDKIKYYLKHDHIRRAVADAGYRRLLRDGHDVVSRAREFVNVIEAAKHSSNGGSGALLQRASTSALAEERTSNCSPGNSKGDDHGRR